MQNANVVRNHKFIIYVSCFQIDNRWHLVNGLRKTCCILLLRVASHIFDAPPTTSLLKIFCYHPLDFYNLILYHRNRNSRTVVLSILGTCCSLSSSFTKLCCNCGTFPPAHSRIYPTWRLRLPGWALSKNTLWISSWTSSQTKDTSFRFFLNSTMIFWKAPWRTATKARWRWIELLLLWRLPLLLWKQVTSWPLPGLRCNRT